MKHVVFTSGGLGSWRVLHEVIQANGKENVYALFTDTMIEDDDLYRFLVETFSYLYEEEAGDLLEWLGKIPPNFVKGEEENRKQFLTHFAARVEERFPNVRWRNAGVSVWDIFFSDKMLGNSRLARCSHVIKQKLAREIVEGEFDPAETTLYLGIDWTEEHRTKSPRKHWAPYAVEYPLCDVKNVLSAPSHEALLETLGIEIPSLYKRGYAHNNCGGFCVRGGQGHFINLLKDNRDAFLYHEEREWREMTRKDYTILKRQRNKKEERLTLETLRTEWEEENATDIDLFDVGGCGCMIPEE